MAIRRASGLLTGAEVLPESLMYSIKRRLLGPPLVNEQLRLERLSRPLAIGVLSCDGISSAAYGTEEILIELVPFFGLAAFTLVLPMTLVILLGIALVVLSYREVVTVFTRAGGSYVVARENFGPRIAQVAAVALLIDYIVTVAVQTAAGSAAILSAFPSLGEFLGPWATLDAISAAAILIMCYGNLRGVREAGRTFALPTYLFSGSVIIMIAAGLYRELLGGGVPHAQPTSQPYTLGHRAFGLITFAAIYRLARAFANGGSSLTGIEAVSNAVSALRPPEGRNARHVLVTQGLIVAVLIGGISWFAHVSHALPDMRGYPTVLAQEAKIIFGHTALGQALFFLVQAGTAAILFTGGNTSFSGFPFLASFVAEDSFLPRWLTKRGHRLVFSNGIIVLTVVSLTLGLAVGFTVNSLIPFYAIGVFTGFSFAGFGMARYHLRTRERAWRRRRVVNMTAAIYTALVVAIFAVVKFTEGAWLVVVVFPAMVFVLIRLNREYRMEASVLDSIGDHRPADTPNYPRRTVFVFVDSFDLATLAALRYARSLRPTTLRAVHFAIDNDKAAQLRQQWQRVGRGVALDFLECPDRRLTRAAAELVRQQAGLPGMHVTAVLPRRGYSPLLGRLLHDRTADKIAGVVSGIPHAAATIVPFDVRGKLESMHQRHQIEAGEGARTAPVTSGDSERASSASRASAGHVLAGSPGPREPVGGDGRSSVPVGAAAAHTVTRIGSLTPPCRATVAGRVRRVEIRPVEQNTVLACEIDDSTGQLTALFYGRSHIAGLDTGTRVRVSGRVGTGNLMINPAYELLAADEAPPPPR